LREYRSGISKNVAALSNEQPVAVQIGPAIDPAVAVRV
jgi:hypothetical protein